LATERTWQHDNLLAKDAILGKEGGAGSEDQTQCAQHGLEDLDKHRREMPTARRSLGEIPGKNTTGSTWCRVFDGLA
jgi:hypothetical protein